MKKMSAPVCWNSGQGWTGFDMKFVLIQITWLRKQQPKIDLKDSVLCFMTTHNGVSTPYATTTIHNNRIGETFYEDAKN
mgnify:CR=1 FL=1